MTVWEHRGQLWQHDSGYVVHEDAWVHDLHGLSTSAFVSLRVPDLTPDGAPFTPAGRDDVVLSFGEGTVPWPVWARFVREVEEAGDLVPEI